MAGRDEADPHSMRSAIFTAIDIFNAKADYMALQAGKMTERHLEGSERREHPGRPQIA